MKCPNCGKEFNDGVKFCDACGTSLNAQNTPQPVQQPATQYVQQPQQPIQQQGTYYTPPGFVPAPPKKKNGFLTALGITAGVLVALFLIGVLFGGSNDDEKSTAITNLESDVSNSVKSDDNKPTEPKSTYGINEAATYSNAEVTVTKVQRGTTFTYSEPETGMEYVTVTVQIKNISEKDNLTYNPYDFKMKNSQGQILDQEIFVYDTDGFLRSGELAPGGQVSGTITYEQPKGDPSLELQYTGNMFSSKSILKFSLQ